MNLLDCFNNAKSDKGTKHAYHLIYEPTIQKHREDPINFLEIGCFRGASTAAWIEYFPNATIYTMDIFTRVNEKDIEILNHPRVKWMKVNSTTKDVPKRIWEEWGDVEFDFVIDDGSHILKDQRDTFSNVYPFLKDGGTYWIEDLFEMDKITQMECMRYGNWWSKNKVWFSDTEWNLFMNNFQKFGYEHIVTKNNRKTNHLDSCVIEIKKG